MSLSTRRTESNLSTLKALSEGLLRGAGRTDARGHVLEIHHESAPPFDPVFLHTESEMLGVSISLCRGGPADQPQRVACDSAQLPFQDQVFEWVVLHHVITDGHEPELAEAARVVARGGALVILGLNRMGWRYRSQDRYRRLPGLAPLRVRQRLESLDMVMQGFAGAGLAGLPRPAWMHRGLSSIAAPVADLVLLQARHRDSPDVTPLRFRKSRPGVVQSAAARG